MTACNPRPYNEPGLQPGRKTIIDMKPASLIASFLLAACCAGPAAAADDPCRAGLEYLGLSLVPTKQHDGPGLPIAEIAQLTAGSKVGLRPGDILEQVNSWPIRDCENYDKAVRDARQKQKAVLVLVSRKGKRRPIFFEPEIWQRIDERKEEKQAVASLTTVLEAPLPVAKRGETEAIGAQALAALRDLESLIDAARPLPMYERGLRDARRRIRALQRQSRSDVEKRVMAGTRVVFGYYETARAIRQYKHDYVSSDRKDVRRGRADSYASASVPFFYDSPVTAWMDKYPFLRPSITDTPTKLGFDFVEQPGRWNPDHAVALLWQRARSETDKFARWVNGQPQASAAP